MCKRALFHVCLLTALALAAQAAEPVGYWPFDGDLADAVGGQDGTFSGGTTVYVKGRMGQAILFDGVDDYVAVKGGNLNAYTITAWVKPARTAAASIVARTDSTGPGKSWSHQMRISSTGVFEHYLWDGASKSALGTTPVQVGEWYFVATQATNNASMELFVDGVKEASTTIGAFWAGGDRYHIGSNSGNSMGWYQGVIDEVRIYDGALSDDEIKAVMLSAYATGSFPTPEDNGTDVARDTTFSWSAGVWAETHDVYFGTTFDEVSQATRDNPMGVLVSQGQTETTYDPEGLLEFGQTYYWRVDEVNAAPDHAIFTGEVWSFTIEPFGYPVPADSITATASSSASAAEGPENVINGSGLNEDDLHSTTAAQMWWTKSGDKAPWILFEFDRPFELYEMLVWNHNTQMEVYIGVGIREAKIEYSLDGTTWTSLDTTELSKATGKADYAASTTVAFDGVIAQYVRITPINNWGGLFAQYGLSEVRFLYVPVQARNPAPADGTVDVPVDTPLAWHAGREAVTHNVYVGTDPEALSLLGNVDQAGYGFDDALDLEATYYWRVDEVNEASAAGLWKGETWSFTTEECLIVDDFEAYTDDMDAGEAIFQSWHDGVESAATYGGSQVGYDPAPFAETTLVHGGAQSMPLSYDNSTYAFSETTFDLSQDWTASAIQSLSLYFYGALENTGTLYLKINNTKVPYNGEPTDIARAMWQPWNVDLTAVGADLSEVTKLTIGIEGSGATGIVYIDDIRLYARPVGIITPVQPDDANMIAHFTFDGNVNDSSGNGANGETHGGPTYVEGFDGQAIQFDGVNDYLEVPIDIPENGCTVAFWLKTTMENCGVYAVVQGLLGEGGYDREIYLYLGQVGARIYDTETITAQVFIADDEWHHIAHMYGDDIGGQQIYVDGYLQASGVKAQSDFDWQDGVHFGWANEGYLDYIDGAIDEVRIYNRTLSQAEVVWLAGGAAIPKPF